MPVIAVCEMAGLRPEIMDKQDAARPWIASQGCNTPPCLLNTTALLDYSP